jgi:hypothetical protein
MDDKQYNKLNSMYEKSFGINKQSFMDRYNRVWSWQHYDDGSRHPSNGDANIWVHEMQTAFQKKFDYTNKEYFTLYGEFLDEKYKREGNEQQLDINKANELANTRYKRSLVMSAIAILVSAAGLIIGLLK